MKLAAGCACPPGHTARQLPQNLRHRRSVGRRTCRQLTVHAVSAPAAEPQALPAQPITLTDQALEHLRKMRAEHSQSSDLLLRVGVKSGGCSGMSYAMDFESSSNVQGDDCVMEFAEGFRLVCDPKSLLYLFGMTMDYSKALIGGGFRFHNPQASSTCGCGTSFGV